MANPEIFQIGTEQRLERLNQREVVAISSELALQLRTWDALEGSKRDIIDFDLIPTPMPVEEYLIGVKKRLLNTPTRKEREGVRQDLLEIAAKLETSLPPKDMMSQFDFLKAKVNAHIAYLERKLGILTDPMEYIEKTMGIQPRLIDERDLLAQKEIVATIFKDLGGEYNKENIEVYRSNHRVDVGKIIPEIQQKSKVLLAELGSFLGMNMREVNNRLDSELVDEEDEYWMNWANGSGRKFRLRVNVSKNHIDRWTMGKIEAMSKHEIVGHFAQMTAWLNRIKRDALIPVLGLTSVHDPEQVMTEGLAQTLHYYIPEMLNHISPAGEYELEYEGLKQMVLNNVHIMVNSRQYDDNTLTEFVQSYCPAESQEELLRQIKDRTENTLKQTYLYSYGIGFYLNRHYANLLNRQGRREFLRFAFSQPITPRQAEAHVTGLLQDPRRKYSALKN